MAESKTPWWKKLLKRVLAVVIAIVVEEVGDKLNDPNDPYPKK